MITELQQLTKERRVLDDRILTLKMALLDSLDRGGNGSGPVLRLRGGGAVRWCVIFGYVSP